MTRARLAVLAAALAPAMLAGQTTGAIAGHVRDSLGTGLNFARIVLDGRRAVETDSAGAFRLREVEAGWHRVTAQRVGYQPVTRDSVRVWAGQTVVLTFVLGPVGLPPIVVSASADTLLDPLAPADVQRIAGADLKRLPVTTLEEAVALSAGAVGESYRGGRLGEQAFVLDGLGVKNQLDASTGGLGLRIPPDILTEASLVTNGFSARYGQAISGLVNVVTKDGGDRWEGRTAYETDRPFSGPADLGLDRAVIAADGPVARGIGFAGALDLEGRLDADPVDAPPPTDPRDPRTQNPWLLPHDAGERGDAAAKLTIPIGERETVRLFGLRSVDQRLLFDPAFKYDETFAPAERTAGTLVSAHLQHTAAPESQHPLTADLHLGYFAREFIRGPLDQPIDYRFGAFTGSTWHFAGQRVARTQDSAAAAAALPGFTRPDYSVNTPWGVPAFFLGDGSRGDLDWNRFHETRAQLDFSLGMGEDADLYFGGEFVQQRVWTFERTLAYLPTGDTVPPASIARFAPQSGAAYAETQLRASDLGFTLGMRLDEFDPRSATGTGIAGSRWTLSPRFAVSTVLQGATLVASFGRFAQAPDYQYLVDAALDDSTRTGRFRRGNPDLGYETATQFEFSARARPSPLTAVRVNVFAKRLDGLVASVPLGVDPDSTIFGNTDYGSVKGVEALVERPLAHGWGARVSYVLQDATATATNALQLFQRIRIGTLGDTIVPARAEFPLDFDRRHSVTVVLEGEVTDSVAALLKPLRALVGLQIAAIGRYGSGLPYSRTNAAGDSLVGLPNSYRLPSTETLDALLRYPIRLHGVRGAVYLDVRNLLGRRNVIAVRRDTGSPGVDSTTLQTMAQDAYAADSAAIPYESPRYRAWADLNHDGLISGRTELMPLFLAAARDFTQPLFFFGPPREFRLGVELAF